LASIIFQGLKICLKLDQKRGSVAPAVYYVVYIQRVPPDRRKKRVSRAVLDGAEVLFFDTAEYHV